jgi:hypothetical protein
MVSFHKLFASFNTDPELLIIFLPNSNEVYEKSLSQRPFIIIKKLCSIMVCIMFINNTFAFIDNREGKWNDLYIYTSWNSFAFNADDGS